ncbi:MAG: hypothetical protein JXL84_15150, partial [Deltaproteobacteria bacterium]|nr:hypothetical protein [Deltaproteobacteria bacterium]
MGNRQEYIAEIKKLVPGDNLAAGEPEIILAISQAMKIHSRHRPREIVEDVSGDDGFEYSLEDLEHWSVDFSTVRQVEYPVDDDNETPDILQREEWAIYEKPDGVYLRFLDETPSSDESMRITYTAIHTCTDSDCTVSGFDEDAVQALAAGCFCEILATAYAQDQDSTINADSVDHKSKADAYQRRASALKKAYYD